MVYGAYYVFLSGASPIMGILLVGLVVGGVVLNLRLIRQVKKKLGAWLFLIIVGFGMPIYLIIQNSDHVQEEANPPLRYESEAPD
ncbi:MAG TPA: hypothetical protein DCR93_16095 [Cytophagales bacterium]|nr:hypothetical protein [Cytophagales bacterium]HAP60949.1 hypothetical protein [Cytophagales bacterium]